MQNIDLIAIGKMNAAYFAQGVAEYQKRLGGFCNFRIIELPEVQIADKNASDALPAAEPARQRLGQRTGVEQTVEVGAEHIALHTAFPASVGVVGEGFALSLGHAGVYLVAFQFRTRKGGGGDGRFDLCAALLLAEHGPGGQQTQPPYRHYLSLHHARQEKF